MRTYAQDLGQVSSEAVSNLSKGRRARNEAFSSAHRSSRALIKDRHISVCRVSPKPSNEWRTSQGLNRRLGNDSRKACFAYHRRFAAGQ